MYTTAQFEGLGTFAVAQCRGQGMCNVSQCKGRVTRTVTQRMGCVARAGAGAEPPGCLWHPSGPCRGHRSPWGESRGAMRPQAKAAAPGPGPPVLHKDDVVESTTSRPLHTVGTYCEAEPGREGSSQGQIGIRQQQPPPPPPSRHPTVVGNGCLGSCIPWGWGRGCLGWPCPPQGGERHLGQLNPPGLAWSVLGVAVSPRGSVGPLGAVPPPPSRQCCSHGR